jgi:hypothetical protein
VVRNGRIPRLSFDPDSCKAAACGARPLFEVRRRPPRCARSVPGMQGDAILLQGKGMKRRLIPVLSALSLLLFVATGPDIQSWGAVLPYWLPAAITLTLPLVSMARLHRRRRRARRGGFEII